MIKGWKLVTYLAKHRGKGGRRVSQQVNLKKTGVISQKSENNKKINKKVKRAKQIIEGQKFVTYLLKYRGNGGRRVFQ